MSLPVLELEGSPFDMGRRHGEAFGPAIRAYAAERVRLAGSAAWVGRDVPRREVLRLAHASLEEHRAYAPDLAEELEGIASGAGLDAAELVIVGGFTDFVDAVYRHVAGADTGAASGSADTAAHDDCTAFLLPAARSADGRALLAQTWDMHEDSTERIVMLRGRPRGAPDFLAYTTAGCVGMIGMNEAGLSVGINNLMAGDGRTGVTWPFAVRRMLQQATLADALRVLEEAPLAGGHNFLVMDASGNGADVEATSTRRHVRRLGADALVHTNHCLAPGPLEVERERDAGSQRSSQERLARASQLLQRPRLGLDDVQGLLAEEPVVCHRGEPPLHVGTCGAVVMRPGGRELWAVRGLPSANAFERFAFA